EAMIYSHPFIDLQKIYYILLCSTGIPVKKNVNPIFILSQCLIFFDPSVYSKTNLFAAYVVLARQCYLSKTTTIYLVALAISDTLCLIWAGTFNLSNLFLGPDTIWTYIPWCCLSPILDYGTVLTSVWIIVCFTLERYVVLSHERVKRMFAKPKVAIWTITGIVLTSYLVSVTVSFSRQKASNGTENWWFTCSPRNSTNFTSFVWLHGFFSGGIPYALIILFSALTAHQMKIKTRICTKTDSNALKMSKIRMMRSVRLLLTVSFTAVALGLPKFIIQCTPYMAMGFHTLDYSLPINVAADLSLMLQWMNSALNFCLYCSGCTAFRKE
uniref:G-protein coupled receptors family 1 profile domain-containing protein n=1 Tax=Latimeria chalumnae TaxID=7897 RepID=H3BBB8_LATCH